MYCTIQLECASHRATPKANARKIMENKSAVSSGFWNKRLTTNNAELKSALNYVDPFSSMDRCGGLRGWKPVYHRAIVNRNNLRLFKNIPYLKHSSWNTFRKNGLDAKSTIYSLQPFCVFGLHI